MSFEDKAVEDPGTLSETLKVEARVTRPIDGLTLRCADES
jgi:hypothetical protein